MRTIEIKEKRISIAGEALFGVYEAKRKASRPSLVCCGDDQRAKELAAGVDPRRGFRSGGRWTAADRPIHRAVRAARRPARVRGKRGPGTGLPVRVA